MCWYMCSADANRLLHVWMGVRAKLESMLSSPFTGMCFVMEVSGALSVADVQVGFGPCLAL